LSAHLWTTNQIAEFRTAAVEFLNAVRAAIPPPGPAIPRLGVVVLGQGVAANTHPLFRKLRPRGTYYTQVNTARWTARPDATSGVQSNDRVDLYQLLDRLLAGRR
jgi:hypothetical protein